MLAQGCHVSAPALGHVLARQGKALARAAGPVRTHQTAPTTSLAEPTAMLALRNQSAKCQLHSLDKAAGRFMQAQGCNAAVIHNWAR